MEAADVRALQDIRASAQRLARPVRAWSLRIASGPFLPLAWFAVLAACCSLPLVPGNILQTLDHDLANHVRHTYEFGLALKQGQLPPLVAPTLNGYERVPLFQYYSGTGYLIPGSLSALGVDAYVALKLTIAVHLAAGGFFSYLVCRRLGIGTAAALVAGTAFELYPFVGTDLFTRGAYPEILACTVLPLLLYLVVRLVQARGRGQTLQTLCATAVVWAYFLPIHPIQAILGSAVVLALGMVYATVDLADRPRRARWRGPAAILGSAGLGVVGSLWFWWPMLRDYGDVRVGHQYNFFADVGLEHLSVLLWPGYRSVDYVAIGWAPQLGLHFLLAAALAILWFRRTGPLAAASGLILCAIVIVIRWHARIPFADQLFEPLQWSYRLLIPAALVGMLCLGFALDAIEQRFPGRRGGLVVGLCAGYVLALGVPYFADRGKLYETFGSGYATSPAYPSLNADYYGLLGSDFHRLGIAQGAPLPVATDIALSAAGLPFQIRVVLRPPSPTARLSVLINGKPSPEAATHARAGGRTLVVDVDLHPVVTQTSSSGDRVLRFDVSPPAQPWKVIDVSFHPDGDPAGQWVRLPEAVVQIGSDSTAWRVTVPPGKAGLYQLPFLYLPSSIQRVDGHTTAEASSDRFMTIVPLHAGQNLVQFETRTSGLGVPGLILLLLAGVGAGLARLTGPMRARRSRTSEVQDAPASPT